jgi:catechol 2,3-dioxygenase-like lactoylglutathione lyase family enzyme
VAKPRPVLDQLNLVVGDMPRSLDFYRRLGLEIDETSPTWVPHHRNIRNENGMDLELDSTTFTPQWNQGWGKGRTGAVIGFKVATRDEVDRLYAELIAAGHTGQQPPYDAFWGARYAIVEDPDGNAVGLMSPSDPAQRKRPPEPNAS